MTKANGQDNSHNNSNVTSIDEARRRAAVKAKAEKGAARGLQPRTWRDWLIGGVILAMALGYFASLFAGAPGVNGAMP